MASTNQVNVINNSSPNQWRRYSVYRDSGVEWLGEIPGHWKVKKVNSIVSIILSGVDKKTKEDEHEVLLCNYVDVYYNDFISSKIDFLKATATQNEIRRCSVEIDDVLITKDSETPDDIAVPALVVEKADNLLCGYHLSILRPFPEEIDGLYLLFAIKSLGVKAQFSMSAQGITRFGITYNSIKNVNIPIPPLPEQKAIASFLDKETSRIDDLVEKKERLLKLLKEKRTALISHAVTKGLDPSVAMKDSGIEWLGEIPGHWEVKQLKFVADVSYGLSLELDRTETEGTSIISLPNVTKEGRLLLEDVPKTILNSNQKEELLLKKGDLLFNWRNGSSDHIGKTAYFNADGEYTHVSFLLRLRLDKNKYESRYYQMFLNNLRNTEFFSAAKTRVNKTYNQTELRKLKVMLPPLAEQKAIASYLDQETLKLDNLIKKIRQSIATQKEYRTALISAAVTGKIDVR